MKYKYPVSKIKEAGFFWPVDCFKTEIIFLGENQSPVNEFGVKLT
jgi:hypothetical protein